MPGICQCVRDVTVYMIFLVIVSTLGPLLYGFHLAELNAPQDVITCAKSVPDLLASKLDAKLPPCIPMTEAQFAALSSMYVLGGFAGAISAGPFSSSYGRLLSMRITSFFFVVGSTLEMIAGTISIITIGRFLAGVGAGASTVVVPIYVSEISPPKERGLFGTMTQVMISLGILFTQTLGYFLSRGSLWRVILGTGAGLGLLLGIGLLFVPESPAWLAAHKNSALAVTTLQRIRGIDYHVNEEIAEWNMPKDLAEEERLLTSPLLSPTLSTSSKSATHLPNVGFFRVLRDPLYRPAIIAVIGIMFAQQFCGINSIMMYSVSLLRGVLPVSSSALTILISTINVITTILCAPLADRIGRKPCLLLSISGMGSAAFLLAISLCLEIKILSALSVLLYAGFFAMGLGPVPFMIASELVGQEAVGATQSWCLASNYAATFIVAQFFPLVNSWMNQRWGGRGWAYFVFSALAIMSFAFIAWWVPETKGKSPDEVWAGMRRTD